MAFYISSRCCPSRFHDCMQSLILREEHQNLIRRSPFGHLVNLEGVELHKKVMTILVRCWQKERRAFRIGGVVLAFEVRDVAQILGLSMVGERIEIDWGSPDPVQGWRFSGQTASFDEILDVIHAELDSIEKESVEATVKHVFLLLFSTFLFPQTKHKASSCLFPYIDMETVGNVAWAYVVYDYLVKSLDAYTDKGKGSILGCSILLQVWLFEHTSLWEPAHLDASPCLFKWTAEMDTRRKEHSALIDIISDGKLELSQVVRRLKPLATEVRLIEGKEAVSGGNEVVSSSLDVLVDVSIAEVKMKDKSGPILKRGKFERKARGKEKQDEREIHVSLTEFNLLKRRVSNLEEELKELKWRKTPQIHEEEDEKEDEVPTVERESRERRGGEKDVKEEEKKTVEGESGERQGGEKDVREEEVKTVEGESGEKEGMVKGWEVNEILEKPVGRVEERKGGNEGGDVNEIFDVLDSQETEQKEKGAPSSIIRGVKEGLASKKPEPAKKSPFTSPGRQKKKNVDGEVNKQRSDKLKAIRALSSCDKVVESECNNMCKEDIETVLKPRGWLSSPIEQMEKLFQKAEDQYLNQNFCQKLTKKFNDVDRHVSLDSGRAGKTALQWKQVQSWFQCKQQPGMAKLTSSPIVSKETVFLPDASLSNNAPESSSDISKGAKVPDLSELEFEAKSSKDGAWYDVTSFLTHRVLSSGEPEVRVRYVGFGAEEDEWVNIKKAVRERSLPLEPPECGKVDVGDLVLCYRERKDHAFYFDAHVLEIKRRLHDFRGCRCLFLVRYDHDHVEERVNLRRVCRRPS
ncbi:uncharacterized protein LOC143852494 isoform X3 [Tasmannia lanceolata]|uniref:uncharacterized protein LOC143852494 isoform X3 n=1 Tax=Tasmannia lanceolata TaxID=3420 RepID=UPI004062BB49